MKSQLGIALVSALLILAFLAVVGGALLTTTTIDLQVVDNYKRDTRLLFTAEAGIEDGRARLRGDFSPPTTALQTAAGPDGLLATSRDLSTLLSADDVPLVEAVPFLDTDGVEHGDYHVFLRNDVAEGADSVQDRNGILALLGIARDGDHQRVIEVELERAGFPQLPSALTLNGRAPGFDLRMSGLTVDGRDRCGGASQHAVGLLDDTDVAFVASSIAAGAATRYIGIDPFPDIANVVTSLPGQLTRPQALEAIVEKFRRMADAVHSPGHTGLTVLGSIGAVNDPRIVVVDGDARLGPGQGHGVLLVRGRLTLEGDFVWRGLVLVIGQGELDWRLGHGEINGNVFVAKTRGVRSSAKPLGDPLNSRGDVDVNFLAGGNGIFYDSCAIRNAFQKLPYVPVSYRGY